MDPSYCIITCGIMELPSEVEPQVCRDFRPAIVRLEKSLRRLGYQGDFAFWDKEYPPGCPTHRESPWAFKPFCFADAFSKGYDVVVWLDASIEVARPVDELFTWIREDGYLFFHETHSLGEYCKDDALRTLKIGREESFQMPCCRAGAIGLDFRRDNCRRFLETWKSLAVDGTTFAGPKWSGVRGYPAIASSDPRVKGHRHDQTAASAVAIKLGMTHWKPTIVFDRQFKNFRRLVPTLSVDLAVKQLDSGVDGYLNGSKKLVLFFTRGRGRGHAIPDVEIIESITNTRRDLEVLFVSYGQGADTLRDLGQTVIDLACSEEVSFLEMLRFANSVMRHLLPAFVISHQEFAVPLACGLLGASNVLITDWFPTGLAEEALSDATSIVFLGDKGIFPVPQSIRSTPIYVGPVVRKLKHERSHKNEEREKMGLRVDSLVLSVIPGAWATEARLPIASLVLESFNLLEVEHKTLLWLTVEDCDLLTDIARECGDIRILKMRGSIDEVLVVSDLIITKGNRGTTFEAASLGVPTIALVNRQNPIDEIWLATIQSNRSFHAHAIDAPTLATVIHDLTKRDGEHVSHQPLNWHFRGADSAARGLLNEMEKLPIFSVSAPCIKR